MSKPWWAELIEVSRFKGVDFFDVMPLFADSRAMSDVVTGVMEKIREIASERDVGEFTTLNIDKVVAIESRGFIIGAAIAQTYNFGFVPIRKAGKLPGTVLQEEAEIEYASRVFELQEDRIKPGEHVIIIDDLLGTGGSALAATRLVERTGGVVEGIVTLLEIPELGGREKIAAIKVEGKDEPKYKYGSVLLVHESTDP